MITLHDISVEFTKSDKSVFKAVDHVSLSIPRGEVYGIVGYSGAGKSTLVRVMNLLQKPSAGKVVVNQQDLLALNTRQLRAARKKIGMIFQHFNLMNARTVYQNVLYPLRHSALSKQEKAQKVMQLLALVGLAEKKDVYPSQLSGGQKQRVAIARALANEPQILLCDEATSALDPKSTLSILKLLKTLNQQLGITIVLITHEMQVVKEICHRVAVMEHGRVIEAGSLVSLFSQPQEALTQDFIRTASHIDQAYETILSTPQLAQLSENEQLYEVRYQGSHQFTPFVSDIYQQFSLSVTILYSHIEILQGQPVGQLIIKLAADPLQAEMVINFLAKHQLVMRRLASLQNENFYTI